jgi:hypothetical protein
VLPVQLQQLTEAIPVEGSSGQNTGRQSLRRAKTAMTTRQEKPDIGKHQLASYLAE